jgi:hypothetical protein
MSGSISTPPDILSGIFDPAAARKALQVQHSGINVTDAAYGAVDDGLGGYFLVTWAHNGTTLSLYSSNCAVTVANTGPGGVAKVTLPGATSGNAATPHQDWVGKPIAIAGAGTAGGTLVALVTSFYYDFANSDTATILLNIAAPTTLTASAQQVACPCFTNGSDASGLSTCVGKTLWMNTGGQVPGTGGTPVQANLQFTPEEATISTYTSPFQVTLATPWNGWGQTGAPARVMWGTNNTAAVVAAGTAAINQGQDSLYFQGGNYTYSTGKFCLFDYENDNGGQTATTFLNSGIMSALHWISSSASVFVTADAAYSDSTSSQFSGTFQNDQLYKSAIPDTAGALPAPKVSIDASQHFPRLNTLNAFVVLVIGDSWANGDPTGEGNAVWGPFAANLQRQNPGKKVYFVNNGTNGVTWNALTQNIASSSTVTVNGLGAVTPDLVCLFLTGGNDGAGGLLYNDIVYCVNTIKSWTTANGYPPDICMLTGTYPRTMEEFSANGDSNITSHEYGSVLHRSFCRVRGIAFVDIARHGAFALRGWSEDQLALRNVPPPPAGNCAPQSNSAPTGYVVPYQCRDFFMAVQLGTGTGASFWSTVGALELQISPKPDNRLIFSVDGSNNLTIAATAWGMSIATVISIANGSATLTTGTPTSVSYTGVIGGPTAPNYKFGGGTSLMSSAMVMQCLLSPGGYCGNEDLRTWVTGYTNSNIAFITDAGDGTNEPSAMTSSGTFYYGGQMFVANDVLCKTDVVIGGAGSSPHPLTGANSLVTTLASYTSKTSVTLNAVNAQTSLSAVSKNVFVGRISVPPTYNLAVAAGSDSAGSGNISPILTIRKTGTHVKIGYILGGSTLADIRQNIQANEKLVWEGEVEIFGGPFFPRFFTRDASATLTPLYMWIDDRDANLRRPLMTMRQAFGAVDQVYGSAPFGGDTGHPSQIYLQNVVDEATATQRLSTGLNFANNNGSAVPTTGFSYAIPSNQAFTELNPAGTLATGTIVLPSTFPQGGRLEVFSTQAIAALTVSAPSGFTLQGSAPTSLAAGGAIAYRLLGTTFCRVQ